MFISHSSKHPFFEMVPEQKSCSEPLKESIQEQNKGNIQSENDTCYIFDLELWQWEKEESNIVKHTEIKRESMPAPDISSLFSRELPFFLVHWIVTWTVSKVCRSFGSKLFSKRFLISCGLLWHPFESKEYLWLLVCCCLRLYELSLGLR